MKFPRLMLGAAALYLVLPAIASAGDKDTGLSLPSLLPKAWQANPPLEMTVITELTEAGKKLPPVTPQRPAYFHLHASGYKQLGDGLAGEKLAPPEEIERMMLRSLAANGYLPAELPTHQPSLLITYFWGSHNLVDSFSADEITNSKLERATLVGGEKFAKKLSELYSASDEFYRAFGGMLDDKLVAASNPLNQFRASDPKIGRLLDQTGSEIYYVVASAYDYRAGVENRRVLLWRTRMTVRSQGVTQRESLPTLVLNAAPYFGREMSGAEFISTRAGHDGRVEVGTPTVVEPTTPPAPAPVPAGAPKTAR